MAVAAAAAIAAAAAVSVAAAAFALYAAFVPLVGPAWAAAIVAAVAAVLVLIAGLLARARAEGGHRRRREAAPDASLVQKVVEMAKEHPILATGVALGAGVYAIRNPKLVAAVVAAFMEGRNSKE